LPNLAEVPRRRRFTGLSATDRRRERRTLLLGAALTLVGRGGWRAVTVRAVLEEARLNPRYFYESFPDLDALVVALYDRVVDELGARVMDALGTASAQAPADRLKAVVECIVAFIDQDRRRGRVLYGEDVGNDALRRRRAETAGLVVAFVEDDAASRRPERASDQVGRMVTSVVVGGFNQLLVDWLGGRIRMRRDQLVEGATALFLALGDAAVQVAESHRATEQEAR